MRAFLRDLGCDDRNILIYYVMTITRSAVFVNGNWIFFWLRVMSYGQLGLVDAAAFAFGLVMEIPTGAVSDLVGKRLTLIFALLFNGLGFVIMGAADTITGLVIGFLVTQIGWALMSGAEEALAYDSLKEHGRERIFDRVIAAANVISIITLIGATLLGGVLYNLEMRLPHYAWGILLLLGAIAAYFLREPHVQREPFSLRGYGRQLLRGVHQLTQPTLRRFIPIMFGVLGAGYLFNFGLIQPTMAVMFGFNADAQAVLFALSAAGAAVTISFVPLLRQRGGEMTVLVLIGLSLMLAFLMAALPLGLWAGGVVLIAIRALGGLATPWASVIINHKIPSEDRATTLSTVALIVKIPYVLTAVLAGEMAETGSFGAFNIGVGVFLLVMIGLSLGYSLWQRRPTIAKREAIV